MKTYRLTLNLQLFAGEKTEKPTDKRLGDERNKGNVAKSQEIPSSFIILFLFIYFLLMGSTIKGQLFGLFRLVLEHDLTMQITEQNTLTLFGHILLPMMLTLAPIFLIVVVTALITNLAQIGFLFVSEPLKMKFNKLNPINGVKQIFGTTGLVNLLKSIVKVTIIGILLFIEINKNKTTIMNLSRIPIDQTLNFAAKIVLRLGLEVGLIFIVMSLLDYLYERYKHRKGLKMSKQDIKDENKQMEGDPFIKGKIREKQRRMALSRMMQEVPKADVVITNPTHLAIALQYAPEEMEAPRVLAKGADYVALKMREVAADHAIVIMENKPLARAIYEQVDIGEFIPADLFQAVAEVLAYVYQLKGRAQ